MDKSFCSLIGLCTSCYVYIETVLVRTLTGRTRDYNYFHVTRRGDVIKSSSWTLAKATYDRVFRMERNEHEDGIVIVERDCGTQLLDVKYILNQILSTYQYRDNAFYTKYSVTRMIFMGFYPKENADLKNMVSELAVSGIQVFFYEDRRPIATVEWGAIFDQLSGVYDTDEFLNIQPNFTNSSGKVVTANEPVFPNLSRAIKFKHSVKRIFKRKALMVAVRNLFTTDHDDELRLKKPLKPVKPVIPAATVPQQKRKRRNSEPSVEFQHEKRVKLNFPATPIRKPIKSAPLRMPENWSLTVCPRTISLPVVKVEKKKKTYDSDESYDSDDLGTEISYGNNESYDSDVSYDSDDLGTEISYGNYEYESSSVSETTYIESSNDSDDETDQENVESNSDSESDINIRLRSEPLPRRDQTKSSDSKNRCEHCDVIPQLSQLYADMTKHYDNLNKIWQRK